MQTHTQNKMYLSFLKYSLCLCSIILQFLLFLSVDVYFFLFQSWVSFLMLSDGVQVLGCAAILLSGSCVESSV